ncbi:hypothetical protein [Bradyrhizobium sp. CCBAU 53338]|uniref:hypothetical protein n=1 Tax=Bradyrhizobium sp. CCBAU 53338 TaxID=1325111 RepID=UPI00188A6AFC|nr:hypothetical protein [Bradyrhizobium sp. CCBAU 53338]
MTARDTMVGANSGNGLWSIAPQEASINRNMADRTSLLNESGIGVPSEGTPSAVLMSRSVVTGDVTGIGFVTRLSLSTHKTNAILFYIGRDGVQAGSCRRNSVNICFSDALVLVGNQPTAVKVFTRAAPSKRGAQVLWGYRLFRNPKG